LKHLQQQQGPFQARPQLAMTTMIPVMREAARVAQVPQAQHVARTAPPPQPPQLTAEAAPPRPPSPVHPPGAAGAARAPLPTSTTSLPYLVKYFDMQIFYSTSEKTLDELLNAEIDL
jgi:hypothetical protein